MAAASPAGPPPITATSKVARVSVMPGHLTVPRAFFKPIARSGRGATPQRAICNFSQFLLVTAAMNELRPESQAAATTAHRAAAFSVHIFTALGAGVALLATLEAVREHWAAMFWWLGVALLIDGLDGPLARRLDVVNVQPDWSGDVLDLVVDFTTYVFVPAYAITSSGILLPLAAPVLGVAIAVTGALYFADRRMK